MTAQQTALGAALVSAMNAQSGIRPQDVANSTDANAKAPAAPKSKAGKVATKKLRDMNVTEYDVASEAGFEMYFDAPRREMVESFAACAEDLRYSSETKRARMTELAGAIWPNGKCSYNEWGVLGAFLKGRSEYAYKCMVRAVKALPKMNGKLPSKDGKGKPSTRTASPARWHESVCNTMETLRERIAKCPKADVDPAALRAVVAALRALEVADRALGAAIKRQARA